MEAPWHSTSFYLEWKQWQYFDYSSTNQRNSVLSKVVGVSDQQESDRKKEMSRVRGSALWTAPQSTTVLHSKGKKEEAYKWKDERKERRKEEYALGFFLKLATNTT